MHFLLMCNRENAIPPHMEIALLETLRRVINHEKTSALVSRSKKMLTRHPSKTETREVIFKEMD